MIEVTSYTRTDQPSLGAVKLSATRVVGGKLQASPEPLWVVRNTYGRVSFWDAQEGSWVYKDIWDVTMTKEEALRVLEALE